CPKGRPPPSCPKGRPPPSGPKGRPPPCGENVHKTLKCFVKRLICTEATPAGRFALRPSELEFLSRHTTAALRPCPSLVRISSPVTVLGDIHGQFEDLLSLMRFFGSPPKRRFVFLGDFVDRGDKSLECLALLFCLRVLFPRDVHLLRGNHEAVGINESFGFKEECVKRSSPKAFAALTKVYDYLPVAGVVDDVILCLHGGIGPSLVSLRQNRGSGPAPLRRL
ncbi:UNVERIFIED_CONTAM: hypothetical protein GTU68_054577, partial [Idotea baltica]|nr:hypothetical protein [Idotea baltica]